MAQERTPASGLPGAGTGQRTENEVICNVIDLTSDYDNPCFDPAEYTTTQRTQRTTTRRPPHQEDVTWDSVYHQLPEEIKHQLDADNPASSSKQPTPKHKEASTAPKRGKEGDDEQFTDDLDPEEEMLLIELTDQVAAQAAGRNREATTAGEGESKFGPCPFCGSGRRIFTLEKIGHSNETRPVFRCSDSECLYAELLDEED